MQWTDSTDTDAAASCLPVALPDESSRPLRLLRCLDRYGDASHVTTVPLVFPGPLLGRCDSISDYGAKVSFGWTGGD